MLVKRSWCESRKLFKMPRLCHGTFPTFFRTAHRVSSNLARSLDCSQDGSSGEVRPTGVGSCRVREEEAGVGGGGPPFSGTGAPRLPPASNGGVLPATCARGVCSQGGGRRRLGERDRDEGPRRRRQQMLECISEGKPPMVFRKGTWVHPFLSV